MLENPLLGFIIKYIWLFVLYVFLIITLGGLFIVQLNKLNSKIGESEFYKQVLTFVAAVIICWVGELFNVSIFEGLGWFGGIFYAIIFAFISNSIYNIPLVKFIFTKLGIKLPEIKSIV